MAFPEDVLTADERVVLHLRPHAWLAVRPTFVLVVALTAVTVAAVMLPDDSGGRIGIAVVGAASLGFGLVRGAWPLLVWRCTHYVFTDQRILLQDGVLARERRDVPLGRVNDHAMTQSLFDRMLGCGTLTVDVVGDRGPAVLESVPGVQHVQTTLYELIEGEAERQDDEDDEDDDVVGGVAPVTPPTDRAAWRRRLQRRPVQRQLVQRQPGQPTPSDQA